MDVIANIQQLDGLTQDSLSEAFDPISLLVGAAVGTGATGGAFLVRDASRAIRDWRVRNKIGKLRSLPETGQARAIRRLEIDLKQRLTAAGRAGRKPSRADIRDTLVLQQLTGEDSKAILRKIRKSVKAEMSSQNTVAASRQDHIASLLEFKDDVGKGKGMSRLKGEGKPREKQGAAKRFPPKTAVQRAAGRYGGKVNGGSVTFTNSAKAGSFLSYLRKQGYKMSAKRQVIDGGPQVSVNLKTERTLRPANVVTETLRADHARILAEDPVLIGLGVLGAIQAYRTYKGAKDSYKAAKAGEFGEYWDKNLKTEPVWSKGEQRRIKDHGGGVKGWAKLMGHRLWHSLTHEPTAELAGAAVGAIAKKLSKKGVPKDEAKKIAGKAVAKTVHKGLKKKAKEAKKVAKKAPKSDAPAASLSSKSVKGGKDTVDGEKGEWVTMRGAPVFIPDNPSAKKLGPKAVVGEQLIKVESRLSRALALYEDADAKLFGLED